MKADKVTIRSVKTTEGVITWVVTALIGGSADYASFDHYPSLVEVDAAVDKMERSL